MMFNIYAPPSVGANIVQLAAEAEQQRLREFQLRWQAYLGQFPKPLQATKSDPRGDDNIIVSHAGAIVDKGVSFLFGNAIEFELDQDSGTESPDEAYLAAVWDANRKMTTLQKLGINGGVCGHAFVKIVVQPAPKLPRLIVLDPSTVSVDTAEDDIETVIGYRIQWNTVVQDANGRVHGAVKRQTMTPNAAGTAWQIVDAVSVGDASRWQETGRADWPYPFAPIVDCQNLPNPNEFWGKSDLEDDVLEPMRGMTFIASNSQRIIRHHAQPIVWSNGMANQALDMSIGRVIQLPIGAELHALEIQSDLASSLSWFDKLKEHMHETARIPEVATGKLEAAGNLSGVALAILYQPLIEKTETKRLTYGDLLTEINRRLLVIGGRKPQSTTINWPELLPGDPLQERQVALIDEQLGASQDTLLRKLGYDPDQEAQKRTVETGTLGETLLRSYDGGQDA